jgi:hypothetical protein
MKKPILFTMMMLCMVFVFTTCKKKSNDDNQQQATPTCTDGIQNQGETGIDCGGPCSPCHSTLCDGDGSASYMPLGLNDQWTFDLTYMSGVSDTLTVEGFGAYGPYTYYKLRYYDNNSGYIFPWRYYLRLDAATNNIYQWTGSADVLYLPANPTNGQILPQGGDFYSSYILGRKVISVNETVTSNHCTYTGVLHIQAYDVSTGTVQGNYYFKKGVGPIQMPLQKLGNVARYTGGGPGYECTGNGSNYYFPMAMNNKWTYEFNYYVGSGEKDTITIDGTVVHGTNTYYKFRMHNGIGMSSSYRYFRTDAATSNVYEYIGSSEVLFLPGSPTVGQVIGLTSEDLFSGVLMGRKVVSVTATLNTSLCAYTNCLKIEVYNTSTNAHIGYHYYKKGVGCIYSDDIYLKDLKLY